MISDLVREIRELVDRIERCALAEEDVTALAAVRDALLEVLAKRDPCGSERRSLQVLVTDRGNDLRWCRVSAFEVWPDMLPQRATHEWIAAVAATRERLEIGLTSIAELRARIASCQSLDYIQAVVAAGEKVKQAATELQRILSTAEDEAGLPPGEASEGVGHEATEEAPGAAEAPAVPEEAPSPEEDISEAQPPHVPAQEDRAAGESVPVVADETRKDSDEAVLAEGEGELVADAATAAGGLEAEGAHDVAVVTSEVRRAEPGEQVTPEEEEAADLGEEGAEEAASVGQKAVAAFWDAMARNEWAWAWWIARALRASQDASAVRTLPEWLVRAVWASQYCHPNGVSEAWRAEARREYRLICSENPTPCKTQGPLYADGPLVCYTAAAALLPGFCADLGGEASGWLRDALLAHQPFWRSTPTLRSLLDEAQQLVSQVRPRAWRAAAHNGTVRSSVDGIRDSVRQWRDRATRSRPQFQPAAATLRHMIDDPSAPLGSLLALLEDGEEAQQAEIRDIVTRLAERPLEALIQKAHKEMRRSRGGPTTGQIEGPALRWITGRVGELLELGRSWLSYVAELQRDHTEDRLLEEVAALSERWREEYGAVHQEMVKASRAANTPEQRKAIQHLLASFATVSCVTFSVKAADKDAYAPPSARMLHDEEKVIWHVPQAWSWSRSGTLDRMSPDRWQDILAKLMAVYGRQPPLVELVSSYIDEGHLPLAQDILDALEEQSEDSVEAEVATGLDQARIRLDDRKALAHDELTEERRRLVAKIDEAFVQGALQEDRYVALLAELDTVVGNAPGSAGADLVPVDVPAAQQSLLNVRTQIEDHDQAVSMDLENRLRQTEETLRSDQGEPIDRARQWLAEAWDHLRANDFDLAEAALDSAQAARRGEETEPSTPGTTELERWQQREAKLTEFLSSCARPFRNATKGDGPDPLEIRGLPGKRRDEVAGMEQVFAELRELGGRRRVDERVGPARVPLTRLFSDYLGFEVRRMEPDPVLNGQRSATFSIETSPVSDRSIVPIPFFGSQAAGKYKVTVVWERPQVDSLSAMLGPRAQSLPTFVLYLGRLSPRERRIWSREAVQSPGGTTFLLIDECLLAHLSDLRTDRRPALFQCALPYTTNNPYAATGLVPPEMFFGRDEAMRQLRDPRGSCIVYGGRQLGKSAILRSLERLANEPDQDCFVIYEDIKGIGLEAGVPAIEEFWIRIRDALVHAGLASPRLGERPENIAARIQREFPGGSGKRLLLLLDEADRFLALDAEQGFPAVELLKRAMDQTDRHFKVVFAGLQNVQRYHRIPNHPFAQLGSPIEVGPLKAREAWELITAPLSALGYRISREAALKIRVYTHGHPGLIQYFCGELVENGRRRRGQRDDSVQPPFGIEVADVEDVYRTQEARDEISNRFLWTVGLNRHYEALVYALVHERLSCNGQLAAPFSAGEALKLARHWWPAGFAAVGLPEVSSMLGELEGLGVLQGTPDGGWVVRSPHVVRLLGGARRVEDQLLALASLPEQTDPEPSQVRPALHGLAGAPSPLHQQQMTVLLGRHRATREAGPSASLSRNLGMRPGVVALLGSPASGQAHFRQAVEELMWPRTREERRIRLEIAQPMGSPQDLTHRIEDLANRRDALALVLWVGHQLVESLPGRVAHYVADAAEAIDHRKTREGPVLRVVFDLGFAGAWRWMEDCEPLPEQGQVTTIGASWWDARSVQVWLAAKQMRVVDDKPIRAVCEATGGWHFLVLEMWDCMTQLFGSDMTNQDPMEALKELLNRMEDPTSTLRSRFCTALRPLVDWPAPARIVWDALAEHEPIGEDDLEAFADVIPAPELRGDRVSVCRAVWFLRELGYIRPEVAPGANIQGETVWRREPVAVRTLCPIQ